MSVNIPEGTSTVKVSILNPNRVLGVPASAFLSPEIKGTAYDDTPCLSFLVEHTSQANKTTRMLFDLGIRKDWQNSPPAARPTQILFLGPMQEGTDNDLVVDAINKMSIQITTENDTADLLEQYNIASSSINAIILSHCHFDHTGDLNRFPDSTDVIVGPGFKDHLLPGYPTNSESLIDESGFLVRNINEVAFQHQLRIAGLRAIDWFGDGSFYLLDTPGHAIGHLSALARTTISPDNSPRNDTFVLLAGDVCHHAGELRPSENQTLPECHSKYTEVHPAKCIHAPFYTASSGGFNLDVAQMQQTVQKVQKLDENPNIFTLLAHDNWLLDVVDLFPETANSWKEKNWGEKSRWRFLQDFHL